MKLKVGLFFGGRSTEHEVSVITALQASENLDRSKYEVVPIYVSKSGQFYSDPKFLELKNYQGLDQLLLSTPESILSEKNKQGGLTVAKFLPKFTPIDIAMPLFHGSFGEDGCIQGVFETYQIPYTGLNVIGSAIAMDKVASKYLFKGLGFKVADWVAVKRNDWNLDQAKVLKEIQESLKYPVFVKPATIGSSIGANKAKNEDELQFNLEVAFTYSDKVIVEACFEGKIEVNCSARGYKEITASVCEMPVSSGDLLSFEDKYQRGGKGSKGSGMASLSRVIPAPISSRLTKEIQEATIKIFKALDGGGVARVDFFVDAEKETFWINEVNSPPGSLSFYLWEPAGVKFKELLDGMITDALSRAEDQKKTQYTFDSGLLEIMALKGETRSK
ncbi:MAG: D-alanine--D-alanine ligase family protein [Candidatus Daviesbacteria bacterium]|nr:D-alanine--D-alanine ligase family protein [Candidatus Daviesbacteria bacterium]